MRVEATDYPPIDCAALVAGKSHVIYFTKCEETAQPRVQIRAVVALDDTHAVTADITGGPRRRISRGTLANDKRYRLYVAPCSGARKTTESAAPHLDVQPPTPVLSDAAPAEVVAAPQPEKQIRAEPTPLPVQPMLWDSMVVRNLDRAIAAELPGLAARLRDAVLGTPAAGAGQ